MANSNNTIGKKSKLSQGRPRKDRNLLLQFDVLETWERLRIKKGLLRNKALIQTAEEVKARHAGCKVSQTTVRTILAELHPESSFLGVFRAERVEADEAFLNEWRTLYEATGDETAGKLMKAIQNGSILALKMRFGERPPYPKRGRQKLRKTIRFGK